MPQHAELRPFHFKVGVQVLCFYGKTQAEARANAEAWAKRFKKGKVTRVAFRK